MISVFRSVYPRLTDNLIGSAQFDMDQTMATIMYAYQ